MKFWDKMTLEELNIKRLGLDLGLEKLKNKLKQAFRNKDKEKRR